MKKKFNKNVKKLKNLGTVTEVVDKNEDLAKRVLFNLLPKDKSEGLSDNDSENFLDLAKVEP